MEEHGTMQIPLYVSMLLCILGSLHNEAAAWSVLHAAAIFPLQCKKVENPKRATSTQKKGSIFVVNDLDTLLYLMQQQ
jgi:hypothetical protein